MGAALPGELHGIAVQQVAVDDRYERDRSRIAGGNRVEHLLGRRYQRPDVHVAQLPGVGLGDAEMVEDQMGDTLSALMLIDRCCRRTLGDGGREESPGLRYGEQCGHDAGSGGLTEQRHPGRVAAKRGDVVPDPPQCRKHIAQTDVGVELFAARAHPREVKKSEDPESVVDRHDHGVALG